GGFPVYGRDACGPVQGQNHCGGARDERGGGGGVFRGPCPDCSCPEAPARGRAWVSHAGSAKSHTEWRGSAAGEARDRACEGQTGHSCPVKKGRRAACNE